MMPEESPMNLQQDQLTQNIYKDDKNELSL
jgi:hypothetical protein